MSEASAETALGTTQVGSSGKQQGSARMGMTPALLLEADERRKKYWGLSTLLMSSCSVVRSMA